MVERVTAEAQLRALQTIVQIVASSDGLELVLQRVAEAIAAGRQDRDVYLYVYDADTNELVLTGATESPAAQQVGVLRVACGDGVTGWVAASRRSYLIPAQLSDDPHFLAYPGIGEERYGAIFSVPIVSPTDDLLGCITVWATSGHRFDPTEVPFVEHVAALVAGTFKETRLSESESLHSRIFDGMVELASMVSSRNATSPTLDYATELARLAARADFAVSVVTDPSGADRMHMKVKPSLEADASHALIQAGRRELLMIDQEIRRGRMTWHAAGEAIANALDGIASAVMTAPVRVASDELGLMVCYRVAPARFTTKDTTMLSMVANHAAVALKLALLSDEVADRNSLNWFLRDVSAGRTSNDELRRRAPTLGLDPNGRYVFVAGSIAVRPVPGVDVSAPSVGPSLKDLLRDVPELSKDTRYATTPHQTVAIVPWNGDEDSINELRLPLLNVCARLRSGMGTALTFGISRPVTAVDEFSGALAEAREAMAIGSALENPNGVFTLDDVGHHLLLSRVSGVGSVRDRYATAIARVAEYDRVKGTELLETLAVFLHFRSQSGASRELFVHRNTLNQRLSRVSQLGGFDVFSSDEWFPLQLALKVHQARNGVAGGDSRRGQPHSVRLDRTEDATEAL